MKCRDNGTACLCYQNLICWVSVVTIRREYLRWCHEHWVKMRPLYFDNGDGCVTRTWVCHMELVCNWNASKCCVVCVCIECIPVLGTVVGILSLHCLDMNIALFLEKLYAAWLKCLYLQPFTRIVIIVHMASLHEETAIKERGVEIVLKALK